MFFCHNLKTNKGKYIKVTFVKGEFHKESIEIVNFFLLKTVFLQKNAKKKKKKAF